MQTQDVNKIIYGDTNGKVDSLLTERLEHAQHKTVETRR